MDAIEMRRQSGTGPIVGTSINPSTGDVIQTYHGYTPDEVEQVLSEAHDAQKRWQRRHVSERAAVLHAIGDALDRKAKALARIVTLEMGKPISEAEGEIRKCAWVCRYYAEHGPNMLTSEPAAIEGADVVVRYDPLGTILAVMPWNFPFWQVFRFAAPALIAGNALLMKHAPTTFGCALAIERLVVEAGLPLGVLANAVVGPSAVGTLIADPRISALTLTGSDRAGQAVAASAGGALKKSVLELGGSDAFIVLDDADVDLAVAGAVAGRCMNSGQSCCASKRFMVHYSIAPDFERAFARALEALVVGAPERPETQIGPLARADLRDTLHQQVMASVNAGARLVTGGKYGPGPGFFYEPTLLADVDDEMPVWTEETFGPVAAMRTFRTDDEAIALANDSDYGLCATIWTDEVERARRLARDIDVGGVFVNRIAASDPRVPFGGVKRSGYGRELGLHGLREFLNAKTVWVEERRKCM